MTAEAGIAHLRLEAHPEGGTVSLARLGVAHHLDPRVDRFFLA